MSDRLDDTRVALLAGDGVDAKSWAVRLLAQEVQAFRRDEPLIIAMGQRIERFEKLIADLRALPYHYVATDLLVQMIEEAGI